MQEQGIFRETSVTRDMPSEDESSREREFAIIRRILAGEKDLFRELVGHYKNLVYAMIVRQVGDVGCAEDLTQEVFVKAYLNLKKFRYESKFSTWLMRVALNHMNSHFTSKKFKQQKRTESLEPKHDSPVVEDEQQEERKTLLKNFTEAFSRLKPKFREVISLCGLEGKTYEEAAQLLDVPVGTVRSRLNKARLTLKEMI